MSPSPSRLSEPHRLLVLDAGAAVNLLATGRAEVVLKILGRDVRMEQVTVERSDGGGARGTPHGDAIHQLAAQSFLTIECLNDAAYLRFLALTGAERPDDLGDAQAAAIALAASLGAVLVTDEMKCARLAAPILGREPLSTLDLLAAPALELQLGEGGVAPLLASAAKSALIRVPSPFRDWAAERLGVKRRALDAPTSRWAALLGDGASSAAPSPSAQSVKAKRS